MKKLIILLLTFCFILDIAFIISAGEWIHAQKGYIAATSQELFHKAEDILMSQDKEALEKLMLAGSVIITDVTKELYVVNKHPFDGTAEVRFKGDPVIWWTSIEAIKDSQKEILQRYEDNKFYPQSDMKNEYYLVEFNDGTIKEIPFEEAQRRGWSDICAGFGKKTTDIKSSKIITK